MDVSTYNALFSERFNALVMSKTVNCSSMDWRITRYSQKNLRAGSRAAGLVVCSLYEPNELMPVESRKRNITM
jgi:hypothetical protein